MVADFNGDGWPDILTQGNDRTVVGFLTAPTETATASATVPIATAGAHLVEASYPGDSNYNASASGTISLWGVPPATTTTLTVSSGGSAVTTVAAGSVVTFTAAVMVGTSPLTQGQVNFCDASASQCTDIHLLGTVALTSSGTAAFKFVPGPGVHSYKAVFVQDGYGLTSSSPASTLTVGPAPSPVYSDTTSISASGSPGNYSLTATVSGYGGSAQLNGNISFLDTSVGNAALATSPLGPSTAGLGWLISQTPAASNSPTSEVAGDFNGDGIPDLAVLWSNSIYGGPFSVTILFGKGDGTFTTGPTVQPAGVQSYPTMIGGDFNGDGKADLIVLSYNGSSISYVTALLGNGDGTFATPQTSQVYNQSSTGGDVILGTLIASDFNGDGKLDLAVVGDYVSSGGVTILLGNGDGTFTAAGPNLDPSADFGQIATGDFNGDGIPDLVVTSYFEFGSSPTIFLGKGDGTFTSMATSFTLDYFPTSIVVGDFNGDGVLDLAFSDLNGVEIALGNGDGTFKETSAGPIAVPSELYSLVAGDFNHDGKLDIAGVDSYNDRIVLLRGAGDGTFTVTATNPAVSQDWLGPFAIVAADFNGDGVPDLAMLTKNADTASILLSVPTETATATVTGIAPQSAGTHNVEASYPGDSNYPSSASSTVALSAAVATPVISLASGTYTSVQTVTITDASPGATIYYNNVGGYGYGVQYTGPITVTQSETLQAYATETGYVESANATATYTVNLPPATAPVLSLAPGYYPNTQTVTLSDTTPGAAIYYTTNGSWPTTSSTQYTGVITVSTSETLVASAIAYGYSLSAPVSAQYIIGSSQSPFIYTVAGDGNGGYSGDGGPATVADLNGPYGSVMDAAGNLYIADSYNNAIRKVAAGIGIISTIAGNGLAGYSGDGGAAASAELNHPTWLAIDSAGNLYIADSGNSVIREIAAGNGIISTIAGGGTVWTIGTGVPATSAAFPGVTGMALDSAGNIYISASYAVLKVTASTGIVTTFAGTDGEGYAGDGGPATSAEFCEPAGLALDGAGNLYIADTYNSLIRKVNAQTSVITSVAGYTTTTYCYNNGGYSGDGGLATKAQLNTPNAVAVDGAGNLYIADTYNSVIRKVTASTGIISTMAGNSVEGLIAIGYDNFQCSDTLADGGSATSAGFCYPQSISLDASGDLFVADTSNGRVRKITAVITPPSTETAAPAFSISAGTYAASQTVTITDATPGAAIYITLDGSTPTTSSPGYFGPINVSGTITIKAIAVAPGYLPSNPVTAAYTIMSPPTAIISTVAGSGVSGANYSSYTPPPAVGGPATSVALGNVQGVVSDGAGNLYFTDTYFGVVWELTSKTGYLSVVAGGGTSGNIGDGGPATSAWLGTPSAIAFDAAGNLYIADSKNNLIRKVTTSTGLITTVAGMYSLNGTTGPLGDGGPATAAHLYAPSGLAFDHAGNLYILDTNHHAVRMVSATTGIITTVAGNETPGFSGDGGLATSAQLLYPNALALDSAGSLYIATPSNPRIRKVAAGTGIITTVAGDGDGGYSGDGGLATAAEINPTGIAFDTSNNLYFSSLRVVRKIDAGTGIISTVVGNGYYGFRGDGGSATVAELSGLAGIGFDPFGNLYIADSGNYRIREVTVPGPAATPVFSLAAGAYMGARQVSITDSVKGATIYYTTDGSTPTTGSSVYSGAITVSATETLQAIAVVTGYTESAVASAAYTINPPATPVITWATPAAITYGTALSTTQLNASASVAGSFVYTPSAGMVLTAGSQTLSVTFTPTDNVDFTTAVSNVTLTVSKAAPSVGVTLSSSSISTAQPLTVKVTVSGTGGAATPTGTIALVAGSYSSQQTLVAGVATFNLAAATLPVGSYTLTATYSADSASSANYTAASQNASLAVTLALGTQTATVTATPAQASITNLQSDTVTVSVAGGSGQATPTGTVTLASGSYSAQQTLASGSTAFTIAAGTLGSGANTLTASYSGDASYAATSGTTSVTVAPAVIGLQASTPINPGSNSTSTAIISAGSTYSGTLNLTCALTGSPSGAVSLPTCGLNPASVTVASGGNANTAFTVYTTAVSTSALTRPAGTNLWKLGGGGAALAAFLVFGIPIRRRRWIAMLAILLTVIAAGAIGCGGGGGSGSSKTYTSATTAGNYTFTITGTDSVNAKITTSTNVTVTVQ